MKKKTRKKIMGWSIIVIVFLILFAAIAIEEGLLAAIIIFAAGFGVAGLLKLGVDLIYD